MGRRAISITLAVVCLTVLLGATGLFAISRETSYMQECASEGFAIDGYYRDDKTSLETLAFLEEDNHRWHGSRCIYIAPTQSRADLPN